MRTVQHRIPDANLVKLQASGRACHMLTGDNWTTARIIAARLGIRHVTAEARTAATACRCAEALAVSQPHMPCCSMLA